MRIVAILAVRNEEHYIARCLRHLHQEGIETCVIDNGSTDATPAIVRSFLGKGVFRVESLPFSGCFELAQQLQLKERLASEIDADWFIHHDADEIMQAPEPFATLGEAIAHVDAMGFNAINFDEFTFVPTAKSDRFEGTDYVETMQYYYHFAPAPLRLIRCWKRGTQPPDLVNSGGHGAVFERRRIYPTNFILRHYIALGADHLRRKYESRVFSQHEVSVRGWHGPRHLFSAARHRLPRLDALVRAEAGTRRLDRSRPQARHLIFSSDIE